VRGCFHCTCVCLAWQCLGASAHVTRVRR
jgi:hypothetical protein